MSMFRSLKFTHQVALRSSQSIASISVATRDPCTPNHLPWHTSIRTVKMWQRKVIQTFHKRKEAVEFKQVYPKKPQPRSSFSDWNFNAEIYAFGKRLGENFDDTLLRLALVDKSFIASEIKRQAELGFDVKETAIQHNDELYQDGLEFVRRNIIQILSQEFPKLPSDGIKSLCETLTSQSTLATISTLIGTKDLIMSDDYPPSEEASARTLLAIISALEKSSGPERAKRFVIDIILTQLVGKDILDLWVINHPWMLLVDILRTQGQPLPEPRIIFQAGKNTILAAFVIGLYNSEKKLLGKGIGETLEIAQEMAALDTLRDIFGLRRPKNGYDFLSKTTNATNASNKSISSSNSSRKSVQQSLS